jgi:starvation-inducible DNA-binding protein
MSKENKKTYVKLGFTQSETEKLVENLNILLANYHLHYQKLRNFHWNVTGPDFFDVHEKLEDQYNLTQEQIDLVAERIRIFGKNPVSNLSDYLEMSTIKESKKPLAARDMIKEVLKDFETLHTFFVDIIDSASEIGDAGTEDMVIDFMRKMEKMHWMFTSFVKEG